MFILDTDHLGVIQRLQCVEFENLQRRLSQHDESKFFVTIVSFHEQVQRWQVCIARAKTEEAVTHGYARLEGILSDFSRAQVLPYASAAVDVFNELRQKRIRTGTMDLRIGAIAWASGMTVLTRNSVDFARIPGLPFEDWTRSVS